MKRREIRSSQTYNREQLLESFLQELDALAFTASGKPQDILTFCKSLTLGSRPFQISGHEYEMDLLTCDARRQCYRKAAQMGLTEVNVLRSMWGLIFNRYPQGVLYLFPSALDVSDFSKGRFQTLIRDNPKEVGVHVLDTDSATIKRIKRSMLFLRGARSTSRIEGIKKSSSQLKSVPVDRVVFDEMDEMEPSMIDLALERLSHSEVKEESFLSTPSIPDFGIDRLYQSSDQRIWVIKCESCGAETCLETEFPSCLVETVAGVIRACKKCKKEIFPRNGRWVAQYPDRSKDLVGWWISQLNSAYVEPGAILKAFQDPPNGNLTEVYNSKLGMAYVAAENRLSITDIYNCCGQDPLATKESNPCGMGVDVGATLHVVVGFRPREKSYEVCYVARVSSFNDLHDIAKRFNVQFCVIDAEPETHRARDFQAAETFPVYLCDYIESIKAGPQWDEDKMLIRVIRTELLDTSHELFLTPGALTLPRRCDEIDEFASQCRNTAKVLEENIETGSRAFRYRKLGDDHHRHALGYLWLACQRIRVSDARFDKYRTPLKAEVDFDPFADGYGREQKPFDW